MHRREKYMEREFVHNSHRSGGDKSASKRSIASERAAASWLLVAIVRCISSQGVAEQLRSCNTVCLCDCEPRVVPGCGTRVADPDLDPEPGGGGMWRPVPG